MWRYQPHIFVYFRLQRRFVPLLNTLLIRTKLLIQ